MVKGSNFQKSSSIPIPLTQRIRDLGLQLAREETDTQKQRQVYGNVLAVGLLDNYLKILGMETDIEESDLWNPVIRRAANIADLPVVGVGKLECRSLFGNEVTCDIPLEIQEDRIGYGVVKVDEQRNKAYLVGFAPEVQGEILSIDDLRSPEDLLEYLWDYQHSSSSSNTIDLNRWLNNIFDAGWEAIERIFEPSPELVFSFRSNSSRRAKKIILGATQEEVALIIQLDPGAETETDIVVTLTAISQEVLPEQLQLLILDQEQNIVMQAETRSAPSLEFEFSAETGEFFAVQLLLDDFSFREEFTL